jgi:XTP/dITP diphosphohydrolase
MKKILIATANLNKAKEIINILPPLDIEFLTLKDFPAIVMPAETGKTLEGNAILKSKSASKQSGLITLADDSGLEVDFLGGVPGVYSARYAGTHCSYADNNRKLLTELKNVPPEKRTAQFICVMAVSFPNGKTITEKGILKGHIITESRGTNGFGYDPLFVPEGSNKTLAELSAAEKNQISHRFLAVQKIIPHLKKIWD